MNPRTGYSYDDVLLQPARSAVDSRADVVLGTSLGGVRVDTPLVSSPMDTVTGVELAQELGDLGGLGCLHRFQSVRDQAVEAEAVVAAGVPVAGAVGIEPGYTDRADALVTAGVDMLMVDVAHGHLERTIEAVKVLAERYECTIVAGNVATKNGARDLVRAGADVVKVGIGNGSHCTTRKVAGVGVPQLTAISDARAGVGDDAAIIADGGVRNPGDAVKALVAGADAVMFGREFAATYEAPGEVVEKDGREMKKTRGMSTSEANEDRPDTDTNIPDVDEGVSAYTPIDGSVEDVVTRYCGGLRSGFSYCGGHSVEEARENTTFIEVNDGARLREGAHGVYRED